MLCRHEEAIIVDVTCPFENWPAALNGAWQGEEEKYKTVQEYLLQKYQKVTVEAIIMGALGLWDPKNEVMRRFCSLKYLRLFKKLTVSKTQKLTPNSSAFMPINNSWKKCNKHFFNNFRAKQTCLHTNVKCL